MDKKTLKFAVKSTLPVILGYIPTGMAFGLMLTQSGYSPFLATLMSTIFYAGAAQYLAISFFVNNVGFLQMAILTFLINSKHLFYGISLLGDYNKAGGKRGYLIFSLTDETYALLSEKWNNDEIDRTKYCFYVSIMNHLSWISASTIGALLGSFLSFDLKGLDFAMTALFTVILMEQLQNFKTKLPFIIGTLCALITLFIFGSQNLLLLSSIFTLLLLIVLRRQVENNAC